MARIRRGHENKSKQLPINASYVVALVSALMVTSSGHPQGINIFESVGRGITKEVVAVKAPVEEVVVTVGSSQCTTVKKIFGLEYDQYKIGGEPDLNQLTLNFITSAFKIAYNITEAAKLIPESRDFNPNKKLILYMHGFTDDPTKDSFKNISSAFFATGDCNILALDSSSLIRWLYLRSTTFIRFIGSRLGEVLATMIQRGTNPKAIHLVGHSLGSHISSFAGKRVTELTGFKVGRISGLDPAGPCFSHIDPELRLKADDADFVDVMHTDSGVFGLKDPVGHVDIYPNGGSQQPNCPFETCSHSRAWILYSESVEFPQNFQAVQCEDWDAFRQGKCRKDIKTMGYACSPDTRGKYFLQTGSDYPYGLGAKGASFVNNEGIVRTLGAFGTSLFKP
ncbi:hypothetical protein K1T71_012814 [Dendrolimus kikuchii]|uniref:Uncharacterized protein n=1 Tax=Dendrolimus kikuchii TaxID=765133 RepID=A0ACC1CIJ7_9NEOP|nr:hypothetical protein K1T71_012814 [Dendrolimus kikuchii]